MKKMMWLMFSIVFMVSCGSANHSKKHRNYAPVFISVASEVAQIEMAYNYDILVVDVDGPKSELTLSKGADDTCGGELTDDGDGVGNYTFTPLAAQVDTQCVVAVLASDGKADTTQKTTVNIGEENAAPYFTSVAPTTATEDVLYTYNVATADDNVPAQTLTITSNAFDTCGGNLTDNGDGAGVYTFTPDENWGGLECLVGLTVTDSEGAFAQQNSIVTIAEDEKAPYFVSTAPTTALEDTAYIYNITAEDDDVPVEDLTLALSTGDTCGGNLTDMGNGIGIYTFTPDELAGNTQCVVGVNVSDSGGLNTDQNTLVDIAEDNKAPYFTSSPASGATEGALYTYSITVGDDDLPAQTLTITRSAGDTCAGTLVDNGNRTGTYSFTPGETQGGTQCTLGITVTDNGTPNMSATQNSNITIAEENMAPYWTVAPEDIFVHVSDSYDATDGRGGDDDTPAAAPGDPGYLTCSNEGDTCSFGVDITGTGAGSVSCNVSFTAGDTGEVCAAIVKVTDGSGSSVNQIVLIKVSNIWYVDEGAPDGGNGTSWAEAFNDIKEAMFVAISGDMVWVKAGTYGNPDALSTPVLTMKEGVEVYGGFDGTESSLSERGDPSDPANWTILDGEGSSEHVVLGASYAILDGFRITGGYSDPLDALSGGGIFNNYVNDTVLSNLYIYYNMAVRGGGISNETSSVSIENVYFAHNYAIGTSPNPRGGAVYNYYSSPEINNCIFYHNMSYFGGGGIVNSYYSSPTISNSVFDYNFAYGGGGIGNIYHSSPEINNNIFVTNHALAGGGIFNAYDSSPTINNALFLDNDVAAAGGGIFNAHYSSPHITNATFTKHNATHGGAFFNYYGSDPVISNSILWGDSATVGEDEINNVSGDPVPCYPVVTYSDVDQNGYGGSYGNIRQDPLFVFIGNDVFLSQPPDQVDLSPCVDTGDPATLLFGSTCTCSNPDIGIIDMGFHHLLP